jgi:thiol peroxidase
VTLLGSVPQPGDPAPDFALVARDGSIVRLSDTRGKVRILSCVPSLDTATCDVQTRRFEQELARLPEDVVLYTISMDLPFAQARWCGGANVKHQTLSDHREASFGLAYGVLAKDLRLLSRAVFVVGKDDRIKYVQIVKEWREQPDYEPVIEAARAAAAAS